jgi:hypothetical protein
MLRIGFGLATIEELLPEVLVRFRTKYPGVELVAGHAYADSGCRTSSSQADVPRCFSY